MVAKSSIIKIIEQIQHVLPKLVSRFPMIDVLYLFGSRALNKAKAKSDLDLAIFIDQINYISDPLLDLKIGAFFEEKLDINTDIIIMNKVSPIMQHEVLKTGKRLYEKDSKKRAYYELVTFKSHEDARYYQELRRKKETTRG